MYGDFFLIEREDSPPVRAERLSFGDTSGRNEAWLRDTLFENPALLPVRDIDSAYGPLIPLCKELRTPAGPLDVAFIDTRGRLTLVECKLWRNPEARRKVVAQVLDYARAISKWSYADLQRQVSSARGEKGNVPFKLALDADPNLVEHRFVDDVSNALKSGRFLLLIAGDGIREDVGAITELINRNAAAGFTFGLVEVALYGLDDGGLIVQPRTVAKTKLIERTVVLFQEPGLALSEAFSDMEDASSSLENMNDISGLNESPRQAAYREWWSDVLDMSFDDPEQEPPKLYWPNNVRVPLPVPQTWILAYGADGTLGVCISGSKSNYGEMIGQLSAYREEILEELPKGAEWSFSSLRKDYTFSICRPKSDFEDDDAMRNWLIYNINAFATVLRPRLEIITARTDSD